MNAIETIPVTITPEAAARIETLGFQAEVERMIDHAKQTLPQIRHMEVILYERYGDSDELGLSVDVYSDHPFNPEEHISSELASRMVGLFPPEVLQHMTMGYYPGAGNEG